MKLLQCTGLGTLNNSHDDFSKTLSRSSLTNKVRALYSRPLPYSVLHGFPLTYRRPTLAFRLCAVYPFRCSIWPPFSSHVLQNGREEFADHFVDWFLLLRSRTVCICQSILHRKLTTLSRTVFFGLRASQARKPEGQSSNGLATYFQVTLGMGFIGIANDLVGIVRCLLVNPTFGSDTYAQSPGAESTHLSDNADAEAVNEAPQLSGTGNFAGKPPDDTPDHPTTRFWARRFSDLTNLAFIAAIVPGILANSRYAGTFTDQSQANRTMNLRYFPTRLYGHGG